MFMALSKTHKDVIIGSQRAVESAIEKLTQELGIFFLFLNY